MPILNLHHFVLKTFFFTGFICVLFYASFSQTISSQRKEDMNIKKFHKAAVFINSPEDSVSIPIHSISVVDAMADSSAIGLYQLFDLEPRFMVTPGGFRAAAESYLKKYVHCSKTDSFSVVMVLKKFWISTDAYKSNNGNVVSNYDTRYLLSLKKDTSKLTISLFTNIEFFLFKDSGFYALYRFDSVFSVNIKNAVHLAIIAGNRRESYATLMVQDALETSLSKLAIMNSQWNTIISSKRKFTWHEIESHEHQVFDIPVLKDSLPVPGVYLTFEEFKSNSPSVTEFEVTKDKLNDFIYAKQSDGRQVSLVNVWGYCDSSNQIYIFSNHNFFKLQRKQNAFYVYGSDKTIHEFHTSPMGPMPSANGSQQMTGGGITSDDYKLLLKPFQLDWDSGKLY
jgi:hypothetical protein